MIHNSQSNHFLEEVIFKADFKKPTTLIFVQVNEQVVNKYRYRYVDR